MTRTFRIRAEWDTVLQDEAERQGISVNVLMNKILRRYAQHIRWTDYCGALSLSPRLVSALMEKLDEEDAITIGSRVGSTELVDLLNMMGRRNRYDGFTAVLTDYYTSPDFARWFQCYHHPKRDGDLFHLQHNLGRKWSLFLNQYFRSFVQTLSDIAVEMRQYDYAVTMDVTSGPGHCSRVE